MCLVESGVQSGVAPLVQFFTSLPGQFRAFFFFFVEVACVGQAAAVSQGFRLCFWEDANFWKAYSKLSNAELPEHPTSTFWDGFRKWLFHLDGQWTHSFHTQTEQIGADHTQLFANARYIVNGLMRYDNPNDVEDFVHIILRLLSEYDARQADHHNAAYALVTVVSSRWDVFSLSHMDRIAEMYEKSIDRAILEREG